MRTAVWLLVILTIGAIAWADPPTGTVIVSCNETDAELLVDGILIPERTPAVLALPVGSHVIEVRKSPFIPQKKTVDVADQQQVKVRFELIPPAPPPPEVGSGAPPPATGSGSGSGTAAPPPATGSATPPPPPVGSAAPPAIAPPPPPPPEHHCRQGGREVPCPPEGHTCMQGGKPVLCPGTPKPVPPPIAAPGSAPGAAPGATRPGGTPPGGAPGAAAPGAGAPGAPRIATGSGAPTAQTEPHAGLAAIEIATNVPHAVAYVDGAPVRDAPCVIEVEPGEHVIAVVAPGLFPAESIVHADLAHRQRVELAPTKQRQRIDVPAR